MTPQPDVYAKDPIGAELDALDAIALGERLHELCVELYPIPRSITGDGVRQTLGILAKDLDLGVHEVPSGIQVFDWTVPKEWNVREAYVVAPDGTRILDYERSNLHLVGYSVPIHRTVSLTELRAHLHTLPDRPDRIPYRTSYYTETWGFCAAEQDVADLPQGQYEVVIDASLDDGSLTYGELFLPGETSREILITCHVCHPSLANDNLSGIAVVYELGRMLSKMALRHSYRLLFIPATIGSITWLAHNEDRVSAIDHGLVVSGVGDPAPFTYKRSRNGTSDIDRAVEHVLGVMDPEARIIDFYPYGYDERQFCSPGFDLPVGRLSRSQHNEYPEYHTSADDLDFIVPSQMAAALTTILEVLRVIEGNRRYLNLNPKGEPQLGRRGLYRTIGGDVDRDAVEMGLLWVLNLSDGSHSLLDIAERSGIAFDALCRAAEALSEHGLLAPS